MALYTSVQWRTLCREVVKLTLERPAPGVVVGVADRTLQTLGP